MTGKRRRENEPFAVVVGTEHEVGIEHDVVPKLRVPHNLLHVQLTKRRLRDRRCQRCWTQVVRDGSSKFAQPGGVEGEDLVLRD